MKTRMLLILLNQLNFMNAVKSEAYECCAKVSI